MTKRHCASVALLLATAGVAQPPPPFPPVRAPQGNPITTNKALLGKALFFDEQLSATRSVACATCHSIRHGGSDPRSLAPDSIHPGHDGRFGTPDDVQGSKGVIGNGADGSYVPSPPFGLGVQVTDRRALSVINTAFSPLLFWDGRADGVFVDPANTQNVVLPGGAALETQAAAPPISTTEMAHFGESWNDVAARIAVARPLRLASNVPAPLAAFVANKGYPDLFLAAFGSRDVTPARIVMAIATYERTLVSDQSPWDSFVRGQTSALTASQDRGRAIFFSPAAGCAACHGGPLFTDNQFHNTGVRPSIEDIGRQSVTANAADRGAFRSPSLRNVALRPPYFHNGRLRTLSDVVAFYVRGGDFREGNTDPRIRRLQLGPQQQADLVNFLTALSDPRVAGELPPFDRPTLFTESAQVPRIVGNGTPGSGHLVPEMLAVQPPFLGNPGFTIGVRDGLGGATGVLGVDAGTRTSAVVVGGAGIHLLLGPALLLIPTGPLSGVGVGAGFQSATVSVPADPRLLGARVGLQWVFTDTGLGADLSATAAAELTLF